MSSTRQDPPRSPSQSGQEGTARSGVNGVKTPSQQPTKDNHGEQQPLQVRVLGEGMRHLDQPHELDRK
jgi:hypothetical protein